MKTQELPRKPRHSRPHFPPAAASASPDSLSAAGNWRYASLPRTRWTYVAAVAAAAGLHAAMFYSVPPPPAVKPAAALPKTETVIRLEMPPLPPEEVDDLPQELAEPPAAAIAVPQLAETPSHVALSDFKQTIDLRPQAAVDVAALKSMTVPVLRSRVGAGLGNGNAIFSLAQLDRHPQPISQPPPTIPREVHTALAEVVVLVEFVVDAEGRVLEPRVKSSNAPEFNHSAVSGIMRWKFRPGVYSGRKVATRMEVPMRFQLRPGE